MGPRNPQELYDALKLQQFVPYFQPLVELRSGSLRGFEVLARWLHPQDGVVAPNDFIPLAEEVGCIGELMEGLLRQAFAAAKVIPPPVTLSVNVSPIQFRDAGFPAQLERLARCAEFPLERIVLEVTESALLGDIEAARAMTHELKALGVKLALDDFGTGYSSLRHLQALPFDELKVDASFVRSMNLTRESRKIAAAVIGLGQSLDLTTVAEGVETRKQAEMLVWLGCDLAQGWLYGRPVPADRLAEMIGRDSLLGDGEAGEDDPCGPIMPQMDTLPTQRMAQLQAIYDGLPVGLCFLDRNLRFVSLNKYLAEISGLSVAEHLGRPVTEVIPQLRPSLVMALERALAGEPVSGIELQGSKRTASGHRRTLLISMEPGLDEAGDVVGISVSLVDITERKVAELALREAEEHYRHAVDLNPQIPWTMDGEGMNLDMGAGWERVTGLPVLSVRGRGWTEAVHPDDLPGVLQVMESSLQSGEPLDFQFRVVAREGGWRWMRIRGTARRGDSGTIMRWYGSVEDIDAQKRAEQALAQNEAMVSELEAEVRELRRIVASPRAGVQSVPWDIVRMAGD